MALETSARLPTNFRMLLLLEAMGKQQDDLSASEMARALGLPRQTVNRLCHSLVQERFLAPSETGRGYRPGFRAREMAASLLHLSNTHALRRQILTEIASKTGEMINYVVPEADGMRWVDSADSGRGFLGHPTVGSCIPFHCTAGGKIYLSGLRKSQRERLVRALSLKPFTRTTTTDPQDLLTELSAVARNGYAIDNQEFTQGRATLAVPIRDHHRNYVASLAILVHLDRVSVDQLRDFIPVMREGASMFTDALFGQTQNA